MAEERAEDIILRQHRVFLNDKAMQLRDELIRDTLRIRLSAHDVFDIVAYRFNPGQPDNMRPITAEEFYQPPENSIRTEDRSRQMHLGEYFRRGRKAPERAYRRKGHVPMLSIKDDYEPIP